MFPSSPLSSLRRRYTYSQYSEPTSSRSEYRVPTMARYTARPQPRFQLPYYEDYYGFSNANEDRFPDRCESESDEGTRCGKEVEESSETNSGSEADGNDITEKEQRSKNSGQDDSGKNEYAQRPRFDFKKYGLKAKAVNSNAVEMNETPLEGKWHPFLTRGCGGMGPRDEGELSTETFTYKSHDIVDQISFPGRASANYSATESQNNQAASILQRPEQRMSSLWSKSTYRIQPSINQKHSSLYPTDGLILDSTAQPDQQSQAEGYFSSEGTSCPTCGTSLGKIPKPFDPERHNLNIPTSTDQVVGSDDVTGHHPDQPAEPESKMDIIGGNDNENDSFVSDTANFGDDLRDINQDYHLLNPGTRLSEKLDEVPVEKLKVCEKPNGRIKMAPASSRYAASDHAGYTTRSVVKHAEQQEEEQRLANRRITRNTASSSHKPTQQSKATEYGRGNLTARSAMLSTSRKSRKKKVTSPTIRRSKVEKRPVHNWRGDLLNLQPGQMFPVLKVIAEVRNASKGP
nr:hypothetical protein CFP56_00898 [Quercus suber]